MDTPAPLDTLDAPPAGDTVAVRLRYALTLRGAFAHRVSLAAGLARGTARWILDHPGDSPRAATLAALARALAVDPAWLAFGHPYSAPAVVPLDGGAEDTPTPRDSALSHPAAEVRPLAEPGGGVPPEGIREVPAVEAPAVEAPEQLLPTPAAEVPAQLLPAPPSPGADTPDPDALRARWRATPGAVQRGFAARTGLSQSTASVFLAGRMASTPTTLRAVAAYLDALDAERAASPQLLP